MSNPDACRTRLQTLSAWPTWLGADSVDVVTEDEVVVQFSLPRPLWVQLKVAERVSGVAVSLVQGDLASLEGTLDVVDATVQLDVDVVFQSTIPGALLRELEREVVPRWLRSLDEAE